MFLAGHQRDMNHIERPEIFRPKEKAEKGKGKGRAERCFSLFSDLRVDQSEQGQRYDIKL